MKSGEMISNVDLGEMSDVKCIEPNGFMYSCVNNIYYGNVLLVRGLWHGAQWNVYVEFLCVAGRECGLKSCHWPTPLIAMARCLMGCQSSEFLPLVQRGLSCGYWPLWC